MNEEPYWNAVAESVRHITTAMQSPKISLEDARHLRTHLAELVALLKNRKDTP